MKTLNVNFKVWVGEKLYSTVKASIVEYMVDEVSYKFAVDSYNPSGVTETTYTIVDLLTNEFFDINDSLINTKYFIDKDELIKHLVSQI